MHPTRTETHVYPFYSSYVNESVTKTVGVEKATEREKREKEEMETATGMKGPGVGRSGAKWRMEKRRRPVISARFMLFRLFAGGLG